MSHEENTGQNCCPGSHQDSETPPCPETESFLNKVSGGLKAAAEAAHDLSRDPAQPVKGDLACLKSKTLLLAYSGGPDSTALMAALSALSAKLGFRLSACHVNHHQRGQESERDEDFCRQLCLKLGIPLEVRHLDNHPAAESALRDRRYQELAETARKIGSDIVVTGHTLDDQVETMLFRLFRGTSLAGLKVMMPARKLQEDLRLWRPLLSLARKDCLGYLESIKMPAVSDSSNEAVNYTRNYIRKLIVPQIKQKFPAFGKHLLQLRQVVAAEDEYLDQIARRQMEGLIQPAKPDYWDTAGFCQQPLAIKRRLIKIALESRHIEVSFARVEEILNLIQGSPPGNAISCNQQWDIRIGCGFIHWLEKGTDRPILLMQPQMVNIPGITILAGAGRALKVEAIRPEGSPSTSFPSASCLTALVDLRHITGALVLRARQPGDRIKPLGMKQKVRLKKYLHTHKASSSGEQGPLLLLADQEEVLWIPGRALSQKVAVDTNPTHRLTWLKLADDEVCVV